MAPKSSARKAAARPQQSWLPGERFVGKQLGLALFVTLVVMAGVYDLFIAEAPSLDSQAEAMLEKVYEVASQLPPGGAPYRNVDEVNNVARLARAAADELEDLDGDALPNVVSEARVVSTDIALSLVPRLAASDIADHEATVRAAMTAADISLHAQVDEPHVALILVAAMATSRWASIAVVENESPLHPTPGSKAHQLLLRRAALLEQAIAVQTERSGLRVMYCGALIRLQRYDDALVQLNHLLRYAGAQKVASPTLSAELRPWVEWLHAYATERTAAAEYEADVNMHDAARHLGKPPVESFFEGRVHFGVVDPELLADVEASP